MRTLMRHAATVLAVTSAVATGTVVTTLAAAAAPRASGHVVTSRLMATSRDHRHLATRGGLRTVPAPVFRYTVTRILSGMALTHSFTQAGSSARRSEPLTQPDDITVLGRHVFVAFQNGVGPQGQASTDGNRDSTVVELGLTGRPVGQWDIAGKCDGLTADRFDGAVIATVNEDANSSVYLIRTGGPRARQVQHYSYNRPLPHKGGTDAISVYRGMILISASAPGTTGVAAPQPGYPAVYRVTFDPVSHVATVHPLFFDEARATVANVGSHARGREVALALTDPDSNEVVPADARRFAGDFMLTSQGDKEQIYVSRAARHGQRLFVLSLSNSVDDTAWVTARFGRLYATDHDGDTVDLVTGLFRPGDIFTAVTPCDANGAPATCPAPGFPANYLGALSPWTGRLTRVALRGPDLQPQGLAFVADR